MAELGTRWFVASDGNDEADGSAEHPFRTIRRAYLRSQQEFRRGTLEEPARITVRKGVYRLQSPLVFDGAGPVVISGEPGAVVSGGYALSGWEKVKLNGKSVLRAALPPEVPPVRLLVAEGELAEPAAFPKEGYFRTAPRDCDCGKFVTERENADSFAVEPGDFDPAWHDPGNIYIRMIHRWIEETLEVGSFDAASNTVRAASKLRYAPDSAITEYRVCNVREALICPGEFYYDRHEHAVYYLPRRRAVSPEAEAPVTGELVRFLPGCANVVLENLSFRCAGGYFPRNLPDFDLRSGLAPVKNEIFMRHSVPGLDKPELQAGQAAANVPGILIAEGACDCTLRRCTVELAGWYGLSLGTGCQRFRVKACTFRDLGAGGIRAGGDGVGGLIFADNHIFDCGEIFHSACGILLTHARNCLVEHNHIHDLFYTGISCGWVWGFGESRSCENRIVGNLIHDLGKGILSDMGGIYTLGVQPGTRVAGNRVFSVTSRYYGGWGLYTDEGSSHIVLEHNLVYDCSCDGFHQHYGRENIVRNNIFVNGGETGAVFTADPVATGYASPGENHSHGMNFFHNLVIQEGKPCIRLTDRFAPDRIILDGNLYCDLSGKAPVFLCGSRKCRLEAWRKFGLDVHSRVVRDLGIGDVRRRRFRLTADSILREYGFRELPDAGIRK